MSQGVLEHRTPPERYNYSIKIAGKTAIVVSTLLLEKKRKEAFRGEVTEIPLRQELTEFQVSVFAFWTKAGELLLSLETNIKL